MARNIINIAASVHKRLLNKAKQASRPFNELLQHFAMERFIYRLSKSPHADRFILKGALMFSTWIGAASHFHSFFFGFKRDESTCGSISIGISR